MNNRNAWFSKLVLLSGAATLIVAYSNCSKTDLVPLNQVSLSSVATQSVQVNFCEPPPVDQATNIKTLIILDHSGSNAQNYKMGTDGTGAPDVSTGSVVINTSYATDPTGSLRYGSPTTKGSLLNYLANLPANDPANPKKFFAMIDFSDNSSSYPAGGSTFTSDISSFYNYVYADSGQSTGGHPNDSGATNYITALNMAFTIINDDVLASKNCAKAAKTATPTALCPRPGTSTAVSYVVLFMSDGSPIIKLGLSQDAGGNIIQQPLSSTDCAAPSQLIDGIICKQSEQTIIGLVHSITALASDQIDVASVNFFTVYYYVPGNADRSSQALLAEMARSGNGIGYNALSGSSLNYSAFQPPQKQVQYSLADIFVSNASGVWWDDGKFHPDTDGDGLPDDIELAWGSNPKDPRSAGNGVSDLLRYRLANGGAGTSTNYSAGPCAGISYVTDPSHAGGILYNSADPSGLNDCEKTLLNDQAGINNPDSNADSIPDFLEFKNNIAFQKGSTPAITAPDLDGYSIYQKIKYSLPAQTSLLNAPNLVPANYSLSLTSTANLQNCYRLVVTDLPMATASDNIRVEVNFKTNLTNVSAPYRVGTKRFASGSNSLIFNDWTDATEIASSTWRSWP